MQGALSILRGGLLLLGIFAGLWVFGAWLLSWIGGWRRLVEQFGCKEPFDGTITHAASGRVGFIIYRLTLKLGVSDRGLYLAGFSMFRIFHPPLFIPWNQIQAEMRGRGMWAWNGLKLAFPAVPGATVTFYGRELDTVLPYVEGEESEE